MNSISVTSVVSEAKRGLSGDGALNQKDFRFSTILKVRIGDINYGNHMGNEAFIQFFHEARIQYLAQFSLSEKDIGHGVGLILTEINCDLKAEVFYGDELEVFVQVSELKRSRFTMIYQIVRKSDDKLVSSGYTTLAAFDYQKKKPVPLPQTFQEAVTHFEKSG